jgi:hypothetical protein
VGGCPTVAFAYPGGILAFAKAGTSELSQPQIAHDVHKLLDVSRARTHSIR